MINKINLDNNLYIEAYFSCPLCIEQGKKVAPVYWKHHSCGGKMYLGDDANYFCQKCKQRSRVGQWEYRCPDHSNTDSAVLDFQIASNATLNYFPMSVVTQLITTAGLPWFRKFMNNLEAEGQGYTW